MLGRGFAQRPVPLERQVAVRVVIFYRGVSDLAGGRWRRQVGVEIFQPQQIGLPTASAASPISSTPAAGHIVTISPYRHPELAPAAPGGGNLPGHHHARVAQRWSVRPISALALLEAAAGYSDQPEG